jgi:hypothetical protein
MSHLTDDDQPRAATTEEQRLFAKAVLAGSVAPRSAGWLFPRQGWRQLAQLPLRRRLLVDAWMAYALALVGFVIWALVSGNDILVAYALLAFIAMAIGPLLSYLGWLLAGALLRRARARRH